MFNGFYKVLDVVKGIIKIKKFYYYVNIIKIGAMTNNMKIGIMKLKTLNFKVGLLVVVVEVYMLLCQVFYLY